MTTIAAAETVLPSPTRALLPPADAVVEVRDLVKVYKGDVRAVDGVTFSVERGGFFGFLGPNGAGKTTTIRILSTLLHPTSGTASLLGLDVVRDAAAVRQRIGFAMQQVAVENLATGRENLALIGRLHRMPKADMRARSTELLELMNLAHVGDKLAGTYSGGMKRRLDLATALMHRPEILFLDEPTEGLDPQSRGALWDELLRINARGDDDVPDDPLHGGGRPPLPPAGHHRRRQDRGRGHPDGAEALRRLGHGQPDAQRRRSRCARGRPHVRARVALGHRAR